MTRTAWVAGALLLLCGGAGQDPQPAASVLQETFELARVGAPHRLLARLVGTWDVAIETNAADGSVAAGTGRLTAQAMLGDRYVVLNHRLQLAGTALEAVQILGYDALAQAYTSSWRDDHSTWSVEAAGSADADAPERLSLRGALRDAADPDGRPFRIELDLRAADAVTMRLFEGPRGSEVLRQTQRWTRR